MKRKIRFALLVVLCAAMFLSCENFIFNFDFGSETGAGNPFTEVPQGIKDRVVYYAYEYAAADTFYEYGGQGALRAIGIDCSGLVVMCYTYALENTEYSLILPDMSAAYMYENASTVTYTPEAGDLVFMGDANSSQINHIGIFVKKVGTEIYFIDSSSSGSTNGVSERHYDESNKKIKGYGVMKLKQK